MNNRALVLIILGLLSCTFSDAKKIKSSFTIKNETKASNLPSPKIQGHQINLGDSKMDNPEFCDSMAANLRNITFAGYEKESNSSTESFLLINPSSETLTGFEVKIDYLDLKDRMLHSRKLKEPCLIPPGESRKFDIKSWDSQHTYFYYLGNEPKKVATPYKVAFTPLTYWIEIPD